MVRRQLDALRRLAGAAVERMEQAVRRIRLDPAHPDVGVDAIEEAAQVSGKLDWALRLIFALRAKLSGDLERLQGGETPELVFAAASEAEGSSFSPRDDGRETGRDLGRETGRDRAPGGAAARGLAAERGLFDDLPYGSGDDDFSAILERPTDEIIALICRTLGLPEDWLRLAEEAWEEEGGFEPQPSSEPPRAWMGDRGPAVSDKPPDG